MLAITWTSRRWSGVQDLERGNALAIRVAGLGEQQASSRSALVARFAQGGVEEEALGGVDAAIGRRAAAELRLLDVALAVERLRARAVP